MTKRAKLPPFEKGTYDGMPQWATRTLGIPIRARMLLVLLVTYDKPDKARE